jgi:hypothetical protein
VIREVMRGHTFVYFPKVIFVTIYLSSVRHQLLHLILGNINKQTNDFRLAEATVIS